jgi:argininosuccinate synthase
VRVLSENDVYNGNVFDNNVDELNKIQPRSRDEVIGYVRLKVESLVNTMLKRHQMESNCLYFEQCAEWERYVADKVPMDQRVGKFEDFTLRQCAKHVKTKPVNLDRILR